jgi:hypothetical protein
MLEVAKLIADPPPLELVARLKRFAKLIAIPRTEVDTTVEANLLSSALYLRDWLPMYAHLEDPVPGYEVPDCVQDTLTNLEELIEFLQSDLVQTVEPPRLGGRTPDHRKRLCAAVCAGAWRDYHGKIEPHSRYLVDACEAYWRACGHLDGDVKWQHHLEEVSHP